MVLSCWSIGISDFYFASVYTVTHLLRIVCTSGKYCTAETEGLEWIYYYLVSILYHLLRMKEAGLLVCALTDPLPEEEAGHARDGRLKALETLVVDF